MKTLLNFYIIALIIIAILYFLGQIPETTINNLSPLYLLGSLLMWIKMFNSNKQTIK